MAVENALHPSCADHEPPNNVSRLMRNIILGAEFVMSHITHFYTLAALSYVQGPGIAPWTPYFDDSYYVGALMRPAGAKAHPIYTAIYGTQSRGVPDPAKSNVPYAFGAGSAYTGIDGIWDNVVLDYVTALKFRRDMANASAVLGGRTPMIQNACLVGGSAAKPTAADITVAKNLVAGALGFVETHQIPLTQIVSYLYGPYGGAGETAVRDYDNDNSDPMTGFGAGAASGLGANRVLAWGAFDMDNSGGDDPNRLLMRGCYEYNGATMDEVEPPSTMWSNVEEYITNSRYADDADAGNHPKHPSEGYTNPDASTGYSWAKSPRMNGKACQVGPLARMAVQGERAAGTNDYDSYAIGATKANVMTDHPYLEPIITANAGLITSVYGGLPANFLCGFSTMDRHRARAYEAAKIAHAIADTGGWCDELTAALSQPHYTAWTKATSGVGYGAHEAPRGALAHFIRVAEGKIMNYQCVVPTTWNVNPEAPAGENGPIESAIKGITVSGQASAGHRVAVEALRVVQGFDPCIACTVH